MKATESHVHLGKNYWEGGGGGGGGGRGAGGGRGGGARGVEKRWILTGRGQRAEGRGQVKDNLVPATMCSGSNQRLRLVMR